MKYVLQYQLIEKLYKGGFNSFCNSIWYKIQTITTDIRLMCLFIIKPMSIRPENENKKGEMYINKTHYFFYTAVWMKTVMEQGDTLLYNNRLAVKATKKGSS